MSRVCHGCSVFFAVPDLLGRERLESSHHLSLEKVPSCTSEELIDQGRPSLSREVAGQVGRKPRVVGGHKMKNTCQRRKQCGL